MKKNYFLILALVLFYNHNIFGQRKKATANVATILQTNVSPSPEFVKFKKGHEPSTSNFEDLLITYFGKKENETLIPYATSTDDLNMTHVRYQQYYKGVKVEDAVFISHQRNYRIESFNGAFFPDLNIEVIPTIVENNALSKAMNFVGNATFEKNLKGELVIIAENKNYNNPHMKLAWKFNFQIEEPIDKISIYVDAHKGNIICSYSNIHNVNNVTGTLATQYHGIKQAYTDSVSSSNYRLSQTIYANGIETKHSATNNTFIDSDNYWDTDSVAAGLHWAGHAVWDYYYDKHGRISYDNAGGKITLYAHDGKVANAHYSGNGEMGFGDGEGAIKSLTSLDVVAHEFTHGVIMSTANLTPLNESGALAESFGDIFGLAAHFYKDPATADYILGNQFDPTGIASRSAINPKTFEHPDTYGGQYWIDPVWGNDYGGRHMNCGLQNHWFYLLCEGGAGINDNGDSYNVTSIGMDKAAMIAYRNLTTYLTPTSYFAEARLYAIQAAEDLFGPCSQEVISTTNAWYAVGVGAEYIDSLSVNFTTDRNYSCASSDTFNFFNLSNAASSYYWDFGDGGFSNNSDPMHVYAQPGTYTVKLVGANCLGVVKDSLTIVDYITVANASGPVAASCNAKGGTFYGVIGAGIYKVNFKDINTTSGIYDEYTDYSCTAPPAHLTVGCSDSLIVETRTFYSEYVAAWIDWNGDGIFSEATEEVMNSGPSHIHKAAIIPPSNTLLNTPLRMRINCKLSANEDTLGPCIDIGVGEVEDYQIYVWPHISVASSTTSENEDNCDGAATVNATGGRPNFSYSWDAAANNQTSFTATGLCSGVYSVVVTDGNGCTVLVEDTVSKNRSTDINKENDIGINLYPIPAHEVIVIEVKQVAPNLVFELINTIGQSVQSIKITKEKMEIDVSHISPGIYYLKEIENGSRVYRISIL